jgi:hypothetical protein
MLPRISKTKPALEKSSILMSPKQKAQKSLIFQITA